MVTSYEVATWVCFLIILGMDLVSKRMVDSLDTDLNATDTYVELWTAISWFTRERDVLAVVLLLLVVRFIKYLRLTPGWGPMVVAIIITAFHPNVILFLGVGLVLMLGFSISFHVAFGSETSQFASIAETFRSLFNMVGGGGIPQSAVHVLWPP